MNDMPFLPGTIMLVPSSACQASCNYCFGPYQGNKMSYEVLEHSIAFIRKIAEVRNINQVVFHGGEPLLAGPEWFKHALTALRNTFGSNLKIGIQSNLWNIDDQFAALFKEYHVSPSTSLDGHESMCCAQRGEDYYTKTLAGIRKLHEYGFNPGCICTFTEDYINEYKQVFDFFSKENIIFSMHGAVPSLDRQKSKHTISPESYSQLFLNMLEYYAQHLDQNYIPTIDQMVRSVYNRHSDICLFSGCIGKYAAIDSDGFIYTCQRFCGHPEYAIAHVIESPSPEIITNSSGFQNFVRLAQNATAHCGDCSHTDYCKGGCMYNIVSSGNNKDPYCAAYNQLFNEITIRLAQEMLWEAMNKGKDYPLLIMAGKKIHPFEIKRNKQKVNRIYDFGKTKVPEKYRSPKEYNKIYLNITYSCPLRCTHCSANAGETNGDHEIAVDTILRCVTDAQAMGFKSVVITGGEPLVHSKIKPLLRLLADTRKRLYNGMKLVLRTSLAIHYDQELFELMTAAFSEIRISIDGDEATHNIRRGANSYGITVSNLKKLAAQKTGATLAIVSVLSHSERQGIPGTSVRNLARESGIRDVHFRYLRSLGRGCNIKKEDAGSKVSESVFYRPMPIKDGCGFGHSLHVEPDGSCYPCFVFMGDDYYLGDLDQGLKQIIHSKRYQDFSRFNVDNNPKCSSCDIRYLCGGICRDGMTDNPRQYNSPHFNCKEAYNYYQEIVSLSKEA